MTRQDASIVHVDLDAFFAAVEQRDKPSLRGKPVVVGGTGGRGVVATASYEARRFGARSAMPTAEARRRCPSGTAFLRGRFAAYRISSEVVMDVLRAVTPVIEQVSVDEAFLDLTGAGERNPLLTMTPEEFGASLLAQITEATGGLTASVGLATTKMMAKIGSELNKPAGVSVIAPGTEREVLDPMPVRAISGVGPATARTLRGFGVETVADLARVSQPDLLSIFGTAHGNGLYALARAVDERQVSSGRAAKSISNEETFATDIADPVALATEVEHLAARVTARLSEGTGFARTITIKARWHDFRTVTRSGSLPFATADPAVITREAIRLLRTIDVADGLRLLGVGVSGLTSHAQGELDLAGDPLLLGEPVAANHQDVSSAASAPEHVPPAVAGDPDEAGAREWLTGEDVIHTEHGPGWVWGSGSGVVTVRFEGPRTKPGPVRSFKVDDAALAVAPPPDWRLDPSG